MAGGFRSEVRLITQEIQAQLLEETKKREAAESRAKKSARQAQDLRERLRLVEKETEELRMLVKEARDNMGLMKTINRIRQHDLGNGTGGAGSGSGSGSGSGGRGSGSSRGSSSKRRGSRGGANTSRLSSSSASSSFSFGNRESDLSRIGSRVVGFDAMQQGLDDRIESVSRRVSSLSTSFGSSSSRQSTPRR